jgi:hypothetical protein
LSETDATLAALLGAEPPAGVAALPAEVRADLVSVIADARRHQAASLVEAFDAALRHVPFPVRGIVKKVLL